MRRHGWSCLLRSILRHLGVSLCACHKTLNKLDLRTTRWEGTAGLLDLGSTLTPHPTRQTALGRGQGLADPSVVQILGQFEVCKILYRV